MKGFLRGAGAALVIAALASVPASAQIQGSQHDFTAPILGIDSTTNPGVPDTTFNAFYFWPSYAGYGICSSCHTAHNAYDTDTPLWSHDTTTATFSLYTSPTLDNAITQPQGVSKACLSCHDGTVAVNAVHGSIITNNFTGGPVSGPVNLVAGDHGYIGTDLTNDHPISVEYNTALDPGLNPEAVVDAAGFVLYGTGTRTVECGSCHDPHAGPPVHLFLRAYTGYQTNCLICHNK